MEIHWIWTALACVLSFGVGALLIGTINGRKFKALRMEKAQHALHNLCFEWQEVKGNIVAIFRTSVFANVHLESGKLVKAIEFQRGCSFILNQEHRIKEEGELVITMPLVEEK